MEFDGDRIEDAFRDVLTGDLDDELTAPDGLGAAIALELAAQLEPAMVSDGAAAALCGLLVGVRLSEPGDRVPGSLPAAVETVRVLGRARVIATHCDLGAVARVERAVVACFGAREGLLRLFELGLAIGLAARYA